MPSVKKPTLVLFYMIGCSHCERNAKAWKEAKTKAKKGGVATQEIEAKEATGVNSFPTMKYGDKTIVGAQSTGDEILTKLGVGKSVRGSGRSSTRKSPRHRKTLVKRTLRSYIPVI